MVLFGGDHAFEDAEIGVDSDVAIGDFDSALDGCAEQAHLGGEREGQRCALPALVFLNELHRNTADPLEEIVEAFIHSEALFTRRNSLARAVVEVPLSNFTLIFSSSRLSYLAVLSACKSS